MAARCSTLSFVCSQFNSLNSLALIWCLELCFKHKGKHLFWVILIFLFSCWWCSSWCSGYTTAQFHSAKPKLRFCAGSNLWGSLTMVLAGNKAESLLSVKHTTKTVHHHWLKGSKKHVKSKCGWIKELQSKLCNFRFRNSFCLYQNFNFTLIFLKAFIVMDSLYLN